MYISALEYAFMTIGGPFLDSQQSFECVLISSRSSQESAKFLAEMQNFTDTFWP